VLHLAKVGLAILIVVSVAGVLITPDCSDDVDGTLQVKVLAKAVAVTVATVRPLSLPSVSPRFVRSALQHPAPCNLIDLVCVRLC